MNVFSFLEQTSQRYPQHTAVYSGDQKHLTWSELHERALRLGGYLSELYPKGSRVVIYSKNCPEYIEVLFACWAAGLIPAPINAKLHPSEVQSIIEDSEPVLVVLQNIDDLKDATFPNNLDLLEINSTDYKTALNHTASTPCQTEADNIAWLFFTSGTTGRSKGAMLSHKNLVAMTVAHLADFEHLDRQDKILHAAPMSHGSGLYILPYTARAASHIVPKSSGFDPQETLDLCATLDHVGMFLAPTMIQRLRLHIESKKLAHKGLRHVIYGGGPMYLDEIESALRTFGPIFSQLYGQGESPMTITGLRRQDFDGADTATLNSVGWPRTGIELAIVNNTGQRLSLGEVGEVICKGETVMSGYWGNSKATEATLQDGWLYTGDLGYLDQDGKLTLQGRSKEVIISGGSNIYPIEVENALLTHPAVEEAAVVGQKHDDWGEIVVAFICTAPGVSLQTDDLDAHCNAQIARFKRPKRYIFIDELPKNPTGKIIKRQLTELLE